MSLIVGEIVLIHVHEGTIISARSFTTTEAKEAFEAAHRTIADATEDGMRYLPDGTYDDPDTDTWIEVEGASITYVDGDQPIPGCLHSDDPTLSPEAFG